MTDFTLNHASATEFARLTRCAAAAAGSVGWDDHVESKFRWIAGDAFEGLNLLDRANADTLRDIFLKQDETVAFTLWGTVHHVISDPLFQFI